MKPHTYAEYTDETELAYHLCYDHGLGANALAVWNTKGFDELVRLHRQAHS